MPEPFRAAAVQDASVWLDRVGSTERACERILEAGRGGADVVALPESFIPGFPYWLFVLPVREGAELHRQLHDEAVEIPGPTITALQEACAEAGVTAVVGVTERDPGRIGTLYNTNVVVGPGGELLGKHRKLVPTWTERAVWAGGDGSTLSVFPTPHGALGTLNCGENVNTLARYTLLADGERIHVANFPSVAPLGGLHTNTNDVYLPAAAHAYEGRLFNVVSMEYGTPELCERLGTTFVPDAWNCISGVIGPDGDWIASLRDERGIVYADCDPSETVDGRLFHDIVGHYNRFDVFRLSVDRTAHSPVTDVRRAPA